MLSNKKRKELMLALESRDSIVPDHPYPGDDEKEQDELYSPYGPQPVGKW